MDSSKDVAPGPLHGAGGRCVPRTEGGLGLLTEVVCESLPSSRAQEAWRGHCPSITGLAQADPGDWCWPFREATAVLQGWGCSPEAWASPGLSVCTQCCPGPVSHPGPGPGKPALASTMSPTASPSDVRAWGPASDYWMFAARARWVLERGPSWCFPTLFQEAQPMGAFRCPPGQNIAGHPSWPLATSPGQREARAIIPLPAGWVCFLE